MPLIACSVCLSPTRSHYLLHSYFVSVFYELSFGLHSVLFYLGFISLEFSLSLSSQLPGFGWVGVKIICSAALCLQKTIFPSSHLAPALWKQPGNYKNRFCTGVRSGDGMGWEQEFCWEFSGRTPEMWAKFVSELIWGRLWQGGEHWSWTREQVKRFQCTIYTVEGICRTISGLIDWQ